MTDNERGPWKCEGCGWTNVDYVPECDGCGERRATATLSRARLVAALSASTTERDEARAELAAAYGDTTSEWYTALDRERERAEALSAQLQQAREALERIVSPRSGHLQRDGLREIARAALAAAAPATTLNEPEGER